MTQLDGAVLLPDGTAVRGRGRRQPLPGGLLPEFSLCLGRRGHDEEPEWEASWIEWPDFRVPRDRSMATAKIIDAYERAREGVLVEVSCTGGTGRTGTVIACMAVLAGHPAEDAVAWTRAHYRPRAVETPWQRRWVRGFALRVQTRP
jgi:protein-tyrosine phosphatase